jgi:isochorismate synthase
MNFILEKMKQHKKLNLPFVLYRKPNSKTIVSVFQENDHVYFSNQLLEEGFVFASFLDDNVIVFPLVFCEVSFGVFAAKEIPKSSVNDVLVDEKSKNQFINLVNKGIETIANGGLKKVVLSRTEVVSFEAFKTKKTFERMLIQYPEAFCYCWFHPKIGMWMGATPEKLLRSKQSNFSTMALAGTQSFDGQEEVVWQNKEKKEQEFVTDFIIKKLETITDEIIVSSSYTTKTGNLLHLKTDIEGTLKKEVTLEKVVTILHPTPAVCGLPTNIAKDFIIDNEGYNREYYTGFLGELNYDFSKKEKASDLYVNLRCMKINENDAQLFMGCGVTKDSNPEAEWEETVKKSMTMKRIL